MKRLFSILLLFIPLVVNAQERNSIPETDNLTKGVLPNGISYYLVSNSDIKGYADFSLIQQGMAGNSEARSVLSYAENFKELPYRFLASKGVGYSRDGYVSAYGNNEVIRLRDVPVYDSAAADSTLLLVFDLIRTSPAEQAVIICGDIDSQKLLQQIKMLSLSIPERTVITEEAPYVWEPANTPVFVDNEKGVPGLACINFCYAHPRTPRVMMSGTRPYISRILSKQLGTIITSRLLSASRLKSVPVTDIRAYDVESSDTPGDEQFNISITTTSEKLYDALAMISSALASIDIEGASLQEMQFAKGASSWELRHNAAKGSTVSNGEYSDLCIASYLYGAPVASGNAIQEYFSGRTMDPELELSVFNKFASALLSPVDNLTVTVTTPEGTDTGLISDILSGNWQPNPETSASEFRRLQEPSKLKKTKVKSTLTDPVTSGTIWTFANGFKVIYKNVPGNAGISYALALRGGMNLIQGLEYGEAAFVNDILSLFKVDGMSGDNFRKALISEGVSFVPKAGISDFTIRGETSADKLGTVLYALSSYANKRQVDNKAFEHYKSCRAVQTEVQNAGEKGIRSRMEELAVEKNSYSSYLDMDNLSNSLPSKIDKYLDLMFSKTDDGSLVIIGDIDRDVLLNTVSKYAGLFQTGRKAPAVPREEYRIVPGWNTRTFNTAASGMANGTEGVYVLLTTYYPFSIKNSMASEIACEAIKIKLNQALAEYGMYAVLDREIHMSPSEMLRVSISVKPCDPEGLPEAVKVQKIEKALASVRSVITTLSLTEVSKQLLETSKSNIGYKYASQTANPSYLIDAAVIRNSIGMNIASGYESVLESVTESDVRTALEFLDKSSKVEFIYK